ncbi:MAG: DNA replication and repair protein RecF [Verrucomicrobiota bacterium]|nr:DNA replication and repair protein RecF [Verrucomicrobiota bacterium]
MLTELRLSNFRCFKDIKCSLDEMTSVFIGDNAQGKTTILESICLLMRLQSPRASKNTDQIKLGEPNLSVEGMLSGKKIFYALSKNKKNMQIDSQSFNKRKDYLLETALVVWIGNDDILLLRGGSDLRRRYLDFGASQMNIKYLTALKTYKRALRTRNFLLKRDSIPNWNQIAPYTKLLVDSGSIISAQRKLLIDNLNKYAAEFQYAISGSNEKLEIIYKRSGDNDLLESFEKKRSEEIKQRMTLVGPHRDDILLNLNEMDASKYASEGQQRSVALSLKMAQSYVLREIKNSNPILLIDDVFGELDSSRRIKFLSLLPKESQKIITTTNLEWLGNNQLGSYRKYLIEDGKIN